MFHLSKRQCAVRENPVGLCFCQDASIDVLESTEGVKTVIRCVVRFGVPGGDWRPVMQTVVTNSKLHLDPALADDIVSGAYLVKAFI